ncbi:hypothetical protein QYE76_041116 [Lolium multiflorum]|uniref:Uncharacterized protein n=1 Tax=Lolium multiflorum TaxID=4521 RepID=A0AAD8WW31_LOLMU|nr:hypothetical protein QYE76_041116 [Lolium multiflorum]
MVLSNFQTLYEGYLRVEPDIKLFQWFYQIRPEEWFYHKDLSSKDQASKLPEFKDEVAKESPFWKECPNLDDHQSLLRMAERIGKLTEWGNHVIMKNRPAITEENRVRSMAKFTTLEEVVPGALTGIGTGKPRTYHPPIPCAAAFMRYHTLYKVTKENYDFKIALDIYTNDSECPRVKEGWGDKRYQGPPPFSGCCTRYSGRFQAELSPRNLRVGEGSDTTALLRECHGLDCRVVAMINHQAFYDVLELSPANQAKERQRLEAQKKPADEPADEAEDTEEHLKYDEGSNASGRKSHKGPDSERLVSSFAGESLPRESTLPSSPTKDAQTEASSPAPSLAKDA